MHLDEALTALGKILVAAEHPDFVEVYRYGRDEGPGGQSPPGIGVRHQSGAVSMIWASEPSLREVPRPESMPGLKFRAPRMILILLGLLDAAQPNVFTSWVPVDFKGVHMSPAGLLIRGHDETPIWLRVTAGSAPIPEHEDEPFPDWSVPAGISQWQSAEPAIRR